MWDLIIDKIESTGLTFDEFLSLYKVFSSENNIRKIQYNSDMLNSYLEIEGKGLIKIITNDNGALTFYMREAGNILIKSFNENPETEQPPQQIQQKLTNNNHKFEEFWLTFPNSDEHGIFKKTRILKAGKDNCKRKYIEYLTKEVKHEDIIKALKYEIKLRRDVNNGQNKMTYMKNSLTWLNTKEFEIILETMDEETNDNSSDDWTSNSI